MYQWRESAYLYQAFVNWEDCSNKRTSRGSSNFLHFVEETCPMPHKTCGNPQLVNTKKSTATKWQVHHRWINNIINHIKGNIITGCLCLVMRLQCTLIQLKKKKKKISPYQHTHRIYVELNLINNYAIENRMSFINFRDQTFFFFFLNLQNVISVYKRILKVQ